MLHHRYSEESRPSIIITPAIVRGQPWIARHLSNNNLRQHCRQLARTFRGSHPQTDPIREPCARLLAAVEVKCDLLTRHHPSAFPAIPILARISAYADKWIRPPETWQGCESDVPREMLRHLLQHLFTHWKMPDCFENAWLVKGELKYLERDWYCHLAGGGSLRNADGMPPSITARALHLAMTAPCDLTIRQALRWGQIKALKGSDGLLTEVLSSRMVRDLSNDAIWSRLFEKLVASVHFNPKHFGLIADTLIEVIRKDHGRSAELLVRLPTSELMRYCRRFWKNLLNIAQSEQAGLKSNDLHDPHLRYELHLRNANQWASLPGSKPFEVIYQNASFPARCCIVELTYAWQLLAEKQAMRHCVDTYVRPCKLGRCSIFSVRTEAQVGDKKVTTRHLTIEVERKTRRIIQVRGKWNKYFVPQRIPILQQWAKALRLTF